MIGRRLADVIGEQPPLPLDDLQPGDYWRASGVWYCRTPSGDMGSLRGHEVTEHEDGTITVSPSILVGGGNMTELWPSYLERGVWREV